MHFRPVRTTIRAFGTDCAVTNTTVSYADGRTKDTLLNGIVKGLKGSELIDIVALT